MTLAMPIPTLETERLIMRAPREADFEAEAEFFASEASKFVGGPLRPDETWRMVATLLGHWSMRGYGFWGVEEKDTGIYVGHVGLWCPFGWPEPEIGWTLMNNATGKGYATEAAQASRTYAYDALGWETSISLIDPQNAGRVNRDGAEGCIFRKSAANGEGGLHVHVQQVSPGDSPGHDGSGRRNDRKRDAVPIERCGVFDGATGRAVEALVFTGALREQRWANGEDG